MEYDLNRFKQAQERDYTTALAQIRAGKKQSHWIWFIFPQLVELGRSGMATYYGIHGMDEAEAYLADNTLRTRLVEISQALLELDENDPVVVMGYIDALKLRSSMTLFSLVPGTDPVFEEVLNRYYDGERDELTLRYLAN